MLLRPLAYKVHPYRWPTIGKEISHIQNAVMEDVKAFYNTFYNPANAVMAVAGNVKVDEVQSLAEKWFSSIKKTTERTKEIYLMSQNKQNHGFLKLKEMCLPMYCIRHGNAQAHSSRLSFC